MAEISIGDAVGSGFELIRSRPTLVLLWGLVELAMLALTVALFMPMFGTVFAEIAKAKTGVGASVAPADMAKMMQFQALNYLLNFARAFVATILYCAIFRSVIHPEQRGFGSLRVGATELMLFMLMIGGFIAFFIGLVVVMLPAALIIGVLAAVHAGAVAVVIGILLGAVGLWAMVYVALRLSMVGPMMVDDGKVHLVDAWALTKGKAGQLFLIGLCLVVILIVAEIIVALVMGIIGFGAVAAIAGGMQGIPGLFKQPPGTILSSLSPLIALACLLFIPLYGAALAIGGAPWARAYLDLRQMPETDVAKVFE